MPAPTFGEFAVSTRPDLYGSMSPEEVNNGLREALSDPAKSGRALTRLREQFPDQFNTDDDATMHTRVMSSVSRASAPQPSTPDEARMRRDASTLKATAGRWRSGLKDAVMNLADPAASDNAKERSREFLTNAPPPYAVAPGAKHNVNRVNNWAQLEAIKDANPDARYEMTGYGFGSPAVYVGPNKLAELDPEASFPWEKVSGLHPLQLITGQASFLQRGAGEALRAVTPTPRQGEFTINGVREGAPTGPGLREAVGDTAANAARSSETVNALSNAAARGFSHVAENYQYVPYALKTAAGKVAGVVSDDAQKWFDKGAAENMKHVEDTRNFRRFLDQADAQTKQAVGETMAQGLGESLVEMGNYGLPVLNSPTTAAKVGSRLALNTLPTDAALVGKAVKAARATQPGRALETWADKKTANAVGGLSDYMPRVMDFFSDQRDLNAVAGKGVKDDLILSKYARDNAIDHDVRIKAQAISDQLAAVAQQNNATPEQMQAALKGALGAWHSPDARLALATSGTPDGRLATDIIRALQPHHYELWRTGRDAKLINTEYNPFHVYRGRDPTKANVAIPTLSAQQSYADAVQPWLAKDLGAGYANQAVPGIDKLTSNALQDSHAWEMMPFFKDAANPNTIEQRMLDKLTAGQSTKAEIDAWQREVESMDAFRGLLQSHRKLMERTDIGNKMLASEFAARLPNIQKLRPDAYKAPADVAAQYKRDFLQDAIRGRTGDPIEATDRHMVTMAAAAVDNVWQKYGINAQHLRDNVMQKALSLVKTNNVGAGQNAEREVAEALLEHRYLRALPKQLADDLSTKGQVIVRVDKAHNFSDQLGWNAWRNDRTVMLPKAFEQFDGAMMDERVALALQQMAKSKYERPSGQMQTMAKSIDRFLGLTQAKMLITRGNAGFDARQRTAEGIRIVQDTGEVALSDKVRSLVSEVTSSRLGQGQGRRITAGELGNYTGTAGELHDEIVKKLGVGRSFGDEILGMERDDPGMGRWIEWAGEAVGAKRAARNIAGAVNKANRVMMIPGTKVNEAVNNVARKLFPNLPKDYSAEEAFRVWHVLTQMKNGETLDNAVMHTKMLLIDFADKNAAEQLGGIVVPFIKYYTSTFHGALSLATKNPRRFARLYDFSRAVEKQDAANSQEGAIDARFKPASDWFAGNPNFRVGDGIYGYRMETPNAEIANMYSTFNPMIPDERTGWRYTHPLLNHAMALVTGVEPSSGKSIIGLNKDEMDAAGGGLYDQYQQAVTDNTSFAQNPVRNLAYVGAKYGPIIGGRLMTPQADVFARTALGMGAPPAWRGSDDDLAAGIKAMISGTLGARISSTDPALQGRSAVTAFAPPKPPVKQRVQRIKRGQE